MCDGEAAVAAETTELSSPCLDSSVAGAPVASTEAPDSLKDQNSMQSAPQPMPHCLPAEVQMSAAMTSSSSCSALGIPLTAGELGIPTVGPQGHALVAGTAPGTPLLVNVDELMREIFALREKLKEVTSDRDRLLCEVANLRLELDMAELKRLPEER